MLLRGRWSGVLLALVLSFGVGCRGAKPQGPEAQKTALSEALGQAKEALTRGERAEAEAYARAALSLDPNSLEARLLLIRALGPEHPEVVEHLRKTIALAPNHAEYYALLAEALLRRDQWKEAEEIALEGIRLGGEAPLYVILGMASLQQGELKKAEKAFVEAVRLAPRSVQPRLLLATIYSAQDEYLKAAELYTEVLKLDPHHPMARMGMAEIFLHLGSTDDAISALEGIKWKKSPPPAYFAALGSAYLAGHRPQEAVAAFSEAARLNPERVDYVVNIGRALLDAEEEEEAASFMKEAQSRWPEEPDVLLTYGQALFATGAFQEAQAQLEAILRKDPSHLLALTLLGGLATVQKDFSGAVKAFSLAAAFHPDRVEPELYLGETYQEAGQEAEAAEAYERARKINPQDIRPGLALARLFSKSDPSRALAVVNEVLSRHPENLESLLLRASLLISLGRFSDAVATFEEALALAPESALVNNNFAWALVYEAGSKERDCARGLMLATRAVDLSGGESPAELDTLAEAYRCQGEYDQALKLMDQAIKLRPQDEFFQKHRDEIAKEKARKKKKGRNNK